MSATRPVGFGSSVLSGRARATILVEQTGACGRLDDIVWSLLRSRPSGWGFQHIRGTTGMCHPRAPIFSRGDGPVNWRESVEDKTVHNPVACWCPVTHTRLCSDDVHSDLLVPRNTGLHRSREATSASTGSFRSLRPPWHIHMHLLRIIGQPDDLPATSVHVLAGLRLVRPGISALWICMAALRRDSHQPSTRLEQTLHPQHSYLRGR